MRQLITVLKLVFVCSALLFIVLNNVYSDNTSKNGGREIIGQWIDDTPYVGSTIEIYKRNGKYYIQYKLHQGGMATQDIEKEKTSSGKASFRRIGHPGDYYIITDNNYLEARDRMGLIFTARPKN